MTVTVLVSVRNGEAWLREALDSVLAQTWRDFELLVVDNGSTDGTASILEQLSDARLRVLRLDPGGSLGSALNYGLAQARGELVARMDADDLCLPTRLARQVAYLQAHPEVAVLGTSYEMFGPGLTRRWIVYSPRHPLEVAWRYTWENCLGHPTVMFRKSVVLAAGGYPEGSAQDLALFSRLALDHRVANLGEVLLRYRWHGQNMSVVEKPEAAVETRATWLANLALLGVPAELREPYLRWHWREPVPRRLWLPLVRANLLVLRGLVKRLRLEGDPAVWLVHLPRQVLALANRVRQHL